MKKTIGLSSLLALLSLFLLVSFASAIPLANHSSGTKFISAACYATGPPSEIPGTSNLTPSGVDQKRGWTFSIPNALVIGDITYDTLSFSTFNGQVNTITSDQRFSFDTVWTVIDSPRLQRSAICQIL